MESVESLDPYRGLVLDGSMDRAVWAKANLAKMKWANRDWTKNPVLNTNNDHFLCAAHQRIRIKIYSHSNSNHTNSEIRIKEREICDKKRRVIGKKRLN